MRILVSWNMNELMGADCACMPVWKYVFYTRMYEFGKKEIEHYVFDKRV